MSHGKCIIITCVIAALLALAGHALAGGYGPAAGSFPAVKHVQGVFGYHAFM
ncbi:hypothetical protein SAMN05428958_1221 [Pantoea sesami]|nr:hypothetical protein SAMN05428958_1221 [Pantoea sesami]